MKLTAFVTFLALICNAIALDFHKIFWHYPPETTDEPQMIEVIRWRQSVCLQPAYGVSSCLQDLKRLQKEYEYFDDKMYNGERSESSVLTDNESKSSVSPEIAASLPLENLQSSRGFEESFAEKFEFSERTPVLTEDREKQEGRYLVPPSRKETKPQQIYVTKVLNSPVTATLVAHNCLPDIGIPLCQNHRDNIQPSKPVYSVRPTLTITVEEVVFDQKPPNTFQVTKNPSLKNPAVESFGQHVENKPEIVITNPDYHQTSTSFTLNGVGSTQTPQLQQVEITNENKPSLSDIIRNHVVLSKFLSSKSSFVDKQSHQAADQPLQRESDTESSDDSEIATNGTISDTSNQTNSEIQNRNVFFDTIHGLLNKAENSTIVQSVQTFFQREKPNNSSSNGFFSNFLRPINIFHHMIKSTTAKPEFVTHVNPEVATDPETGSSAETVKPETDAGEPDFPSDAQPEISGDAKPHVPGYVKPEIVTRAKPEFPQDVKPESAASEVFTDAKPQVSPNDKTEVTVNVKTVAVDVKPEFSENKSEFFIEMVSTAPLEVKPEAIMNVTSELVTNKGTVENNSQSSGGEFIDEEPVEAPTTDIKTIKLERDESNTFAISNTVEKTQHTAKVQESF